MNNWKSRLRQAREAKGLNKTEFARLVKVSNPTVTDWEKSVADGGIKEIAGVNLTKICVALGVSPHWLMHGKEAEYVSEPPGPLPYAPQKEPAPRVAAAEQDGRLADSLKLKCESAAELRLLTVYRLASEDGRAAIDSVVEQIRRRLDVSGLP
jgi:transcriptional regulator with XRE-family HTH domain